MIELFHQVSAVCSKAVTEKYSTSFASAIRLLHADIRQPVFNIYGFVRLADEIVDTFHAFDKTTLLAEFKKETTLAITRGISLNPILQSFQETVNKFNIDTELIEAFFHSMELDLSRTSYDVTGYKEYIYGSAEAVGLMCLAIFCEGDRNMYENMKPQARALGAAFQKVNFLRDIKADYNGLKRIYFPQCDFSNFSETAKKEIEADIQQDFDMAYQGILALPIKSRFGVYVAYKYYLSLFRQIKRTPSCTIVECRVRISNYYKAMIVMRAGVKNQMGLI